MSEQPKTCDYLEENTITKTIVNRGGELHRDGLVITEPYCKGMGKGGTNIVNADQVLHQCRGKFEECSVWRTIKGK